MNDAPIRLSRSIVTLNAPVMFSLYIWPKRPGTEYQAESSAYPASGVVVTVTTVPAGYLPAAGNAGASRSVPWTGGTMVTVERPLRADDEAARDRAAMDKAVRRMMRGAYQTLRHISCLSTIIFSCDMSSIEAGMPPTP